MKNYRVVEASDLAILAQNVNQWLEQGWIAQGGVTIYAMERPDGRDHTWIETWFIQVMVVP